MLEQLTKEIWRWTTPHPVFRPKHPFGREVACFALLVEGELVLVDPQAPPEPEPLWRALDELLERTGAERMPVLTTIHYHVRSAGEISKRYGDRVEVSVWGHELIRKQLPRGVRLNRIEPGNSLPAGAEAFPIGKPRRTEMPLHVPALRTLVFGDTVVGVDGRLRVWADLEERTEEWYRGRLLPTLEPLLELEPEHVLATHGPSAIGDGQAKLRRALADPPWSMRSG